MFDVYNQYFKGQTSSYYTYVNLGIVALNAGVGIIVNFILFSKRRREDRGFQVASALYNKLIVENLGSINIFFTETHALANEFLENKINHRISGDSLLRSIETVCDLLESRFEKFQANIMPFLNCYSPDLCTKVIKLTDQYSSSCTSIVTIVTIVDTDWPSLVRDLRATRTNFLNAVFDEVIKSKPK